MKKGITITQRYKLDNIDSIDNISEVIFDYSDKCEHRDNEYIFLKKLSQNEVEWDAKLKKFIIPLSQADTTKLTKTYFVEAQVIFNDNTTTKWDVKKKTLAPTLRTENVNGQSNGEETEDTEMTIEDVFITGGTGTDDYNALSNKPSINSVELQGNKTDTDLGLATKQELVGKADKSTTYTKSETDNLLSGKQNNISGGDGISVSNDVISIDLYPQFSFLTFIDEQLSVDNGSLASDTYFREILTVGNNNPLASKSYVDTLMSSAIKRQIVQTLPTENIDTNTIYMVPKATPQTNNIYDEYMYINSAWELIGTTEVDLSNYQTLITSTNKVNADYIDDSQSTNKFTNATEKQTWNGKQDLIDTNHKLSADLLADGTTNKPSEWNNKVDDLTISTSVELTENTWTSQINATDYVSLVIQTTVLPSGATLYLQPFENHIPSGNPIDITRMLMQEIDIYDYDEIEFKIENSGGSYTLPYTLRDDVIREYDLIESLSTKQDTIDSSHKLSADNVDDTSTTNKFVPSHSSSDENKVLSVDNQGNLVWVTASGGHKIVESQNDPPTTSSEYEVGDEWIKGGAEVFKCVAKSGTSLTWGNLSLNNYDDLVTQILGGNS